MKPPPHTFSGNSLCLPSVLQALTLFLLLYLITDCAGFQKSAPLPPQNRRCFVTAAHEPLRWKHLPAFSSHRFRLKAAEAPVKAPVNLFSRTSPLKVRLEHRELACRYSAYAFLENSRTSAADAAAAGQDDTKGPGQAHHLVFSYDPSALSACGKAPFSYLEGQSVAFVNLVDTRKGFSEQKQGTPKPRLYSLASSPAAPECVKHHLYWGPEGHRDPSKDGLCSALLCTVPIGTSFEIGGPIGTAMLLPKDPDTPIIFACTGTGAAPLRSFLRKIMQKPRRGPVLAYIGSGTASGTPYAREWAALQGQISPDQLQLRFAYSREMTAPHGGRLYVQLDWSRLVAGGIVLALPQHLIEREGDKVLELLQSGAVMYACGRKDMVAPVKAALKTAAMQNNLEFDSFFKTLVASKRWRAEVY